MSTDKRTPVEGVCPECGGRLEWDGPAEFINGDTVTQDVVCAGCKKGFVAEYLCTFDTYVGLAEDGHEYGPSAEVQKATAYDRHVQTIAALVDALEGTLDPIRSLVTVHGIWGSTLDKAKSALALAEGGEK